MESLRIHHPLPGLFRKGSPIWMPRGLRGVPLPGVLTAKNQYAGDDGTLMALHGGMDAPWLDDTDPTGRFHLLLYLDAAGHDLRWAKDDPQVLVWSVLSVSKGGPPLADLLHPWRETGNNSWIRQRVFDPKNEGGGLWVCETVGVETAFGWESSLSRDPVTRWWWQGQAVGAEGRAAADQAALEVPVGLREPDGTLRLPPLPPLPVGLEGSRADPG